MIDLSIRLLLSLTVLGGLTYGLSISALSTEIIVANTGREYSTETLFWISNSNLFGTFISALCLIFVQHRISKQKLMLVGLVCSIFCNFCLIFTVFLNGIAWPIYYGLINFCFNFFMAFYVVVFPATIAELA